MKSPKIRCYNERNFDNRNHAGNNDDDDDDQIYNYDHDSIIMLSPRQFPENALKCPQVGIGKYSRHVQELDHYVQ